MQAHHRGMKTNLAFGVVILLCSLASAQPPDGMAYIRKLTADLNVQIARQPTGDETDLQKEQLEKDREGKIAALLMDAEGKQFAISGAVIDVMSAEKSERSVKGGTHVAILKIFLTPPPAVSAEWKRIVAEHERFCAARRYSPDERQNHMNGIRSKQMAPTCTVYVSGTENDFSDWKKSENRAIVVTIQNAKWSERMQYFVDRNDARISYFYLSKMEITAAKN